MTGAAVVLTMALVEAQRRFPGVPVAELGDAVQDIVCEWAGDAAEQRAQFGEPEDTQSVVHCDDWGTGEGRYHGRM